MLTKYRVSQIPYFYKVSRKPQLEKQMCSKTKTKFLNFFVLEIRVAFVSASFKNCVSLLFVTKTIQVFYNKVLVSNTVLETLKMAPPATYS